MGGIRRQELAALIDESCERIHIGGHVRRKPIARFGGREHRGRVAQRTPKLGDVHLHGLPRRRRRLVAPQLVHDPIEREGVPAMEHEQGQHRSLAHPRELCAVAVDDQLEGSQDANLDR